MTMNSNKKIAELLHPQKGPSKITLLWQLNPNAQKAFWLLVAKHQLMN